MKTAKLPRVFKFKAGSDEVVVEDPNINLSPDEVMNLYSNQYSELTNATCNGPVIKDDKAVYEFSTTVGTKG